MHKMTLTQKAVYLCMFPMAGVMVLMALQGRNVAAFAVFFVVVIIHLYPKKGLE